MSAYKQVIEVYIDKPKEKNISLAEKKQSEMSMSISKISQVRKNATKDETGNIQNSELARNENKKFKNRK